MVHSTAHHSFNSFRNRNTLSLRHFSSNLSLSPSFLCVLLYNIFPLFTCRWTHALSKKHKHIYMHINYFKVLRYTAVDMKWLLSLSVVLYEMTDVTGLFIWALRQALIISSTSPKKRTLKSINISGHGCVSHCCQYCPFFSYFLPHFLKKKIVDLNLNIQKYLTMNSRVPDKRSLFQIYLIATTLCDVQCVHNVVNTINNIQTIFIQAVLCSSVFVCEYKHMSATTLVSIYSHKCFFFQCAVEDSQSTHSSF